MKSNRQRRAELDQSRARKRQKKAKVDALWASRRRVNFEQLDVLVGKAALGPRGGFPKYAPHGYYADRSFQCKDCGKDEVWTATQQKWWYEVAKGNPYVVRVRCTPCGRAYQRRRLKSREQTAGKRSGAQR